MYKLYYSGVAPLTRLAQSVERTPFKRVVVGSSPTVSDSFGFFFVLLLCVVLIGTSH